MILTKNEEDYLKALFYLIVEEEQEYAGTNQLAETMGLSPASVNGMLKKLRSKALVSYEKYGKLQLTAEGESIAVKLVRRHRLWETFLCQHMNFEWDEVHEVAEQLEHIRSSKLVEELDRFLGFPKKDPHGAMIPGNDGSYALKPKITLAELSTGARCKLESVKDDSIGFLKYVSQIGLELSCEIEIKEYREFDGSMQIAFNGKLENVSKKFAKNIFITPV